MTLKTKHPIAQAERRSFWGGFWEGLGAAGLLWGARAQQSCNEDFQPMPLPSRTRGNIATDWQAVGKYLDGGQ